MYRTYQSNKLYLELFLFQKKLIRQYSGNILKLNNKLKNNFSNVKSKK